MKRRMLVFAMVVLSGSAGFVAGQSRVMRPTAEPVIYAGEDFGFRAEGHVGDLSREGRGWVSGTFVVKIDGKWVEARLGSKLVPVK